MIVIMKVRQLLILFIFIFNIAYPQSQKKTLGTSVQGSLTVTVTVVPSVWRVMEPDGEQEVALAKALDSKEFFSQGPQRKPKPAAHSKHPVKASGSIIQQNGRSEGAISEVISTRSTKFEVTEETKMMNVVDGDKMTQQPVRVTTIVPQ